MGIETIRTCDRAGCRKREVDLPNQASQEICLVNDVELEKDEDGLLACKVYHDSRRYSFGPWVCQSCRRDLAITINEWFNTPKKEGELTDGTES